MGSQLFAHADGLKKYGMEKIPAIATRGVLLGVDGARYLASLGVAMVGADTWGVEAVPFEKVHQAWEFLFTLGPSRITGAVQAIINPIVIK